MTPKRKCTETVVCRSRPKSNGYHYINVKVGISYWQKKYKKSYQHKNTKPSGCFFVYLDIKKRVSILFGLLNIIGWRPQLFGQKNITKQPGLIPTPNSNGKRESGSLQKTTRKQVLLFKGRTKSHPW
jgi:hypothetical protein